MAAAGGRVVTDRGAGRERRLARKSAAYNGLTDRYEIRHGDFRDARDARGRGAVRPGARQPAVLSRRAPESKATIRRRSRAGSSCAATSPTTRASPPRTSRRAACSRASFPRSSARGSRTRPTRAALVIVRRRPVVFREGEPPLVALFAMMRAPTCRNDMRARTWVEPPLVIRAADGSVHPEYAAVKLAVGFPP